MKIKGIRIEDTENGIVSIKLQDILEEVQKGNDLNWSILFFYGSGHLNNAQSIPVLQRKLVSQ